MAEMSTDARTIASIYDEFGEHYDNSRKEESGRFTNEYIDLPTLTSLLDADLSGKHVLDAGCGSGIISELLARRGAVVSAIDASAKMIELAIKRKPDDLEISYAVGDIEHLDVTDDAIDLVVCNYVLENVSDIAGVFTEFKRVMNSGAICIYSISHPLRALTEKKKDDDQEVWVLRNYFDHSLRHSDFGGGMIVPKYKRTIADYVNAASDTGLLIRRMVEAQPVADAKSVFPDAFEKAMRLPQLLTIELIA